MEKSVLLVEGVDDKGFFTVLLEKTNLHDSVDVHPPSDAGIEGNGVDSLLQSLPILIEQLQIGKIKKIAIVVDADAKKHGFGYAKRREQILQILTPFGYTGSEEPSSPLSGEHFLHTDSVLAPIGLWIMCNPQQKEGMLEDFLLPCITLEDRRNILDIVTDGIDLLKSKASLGKIRFSDTHENKVRFSTWLDWQKKPNNCRALTPACALKEEWIDSEHTHIQALKTWLTASFA